MFFNFIFRYFNNCSAIIFSFCNTVLNLYLKELILVLLHPVNLYKLLNSSQSNKALCLVHAKGRRHFLHKASKELDVPGNLFQLLLMSQQLIFVYFIFINPNSHLNSNRKRIDNNLFVSNKI